MSFFAVSLLRVPNLDVITAHQVGLSNASDPELLAWAAEHETIVSCSDMVEWENVVRHLPFQLRERSLVFSGDYLNLKFREISQLEPVEINCAGKCAGGRVIGGVGAKQFQIYGMISNDLIFSPSSSKKNRRFTGLPGKLPVRRLVTTAFRSS
jgi:hypothetical protein